MALRACLQTPGSSAHQVMLAPTGHVSIGPERRCMQKGCAMNGEPKMEVSSLRSLRSDVLTLLGAFPKRVPLRPRVGATIDERGYARGRVTYRVEAGERVPAWLL